MQIGTELTDSQLQPVCLYWSMAKTLDDAKKLLHTYIENPQLLIHSHAVSVIMQYFAKKMGTDVEKWGIIGLLHDLDWEKYPDEHCYKTKEILIAEGYDEDIIHAVMSHGWKIVTDVEPEEYLEKILYTIDELSGFIIACALVRPSRGLYDLKLASMKKKWKSASFAAGANREIIKSGAAMLSMELDDIMTETLTAMKAHAALLGLNTDPATP